MELFPSQPDLSLQISPPNSKSTPNWKRTTEDHQNLDMGYLKRALDTRNPNTISSSMASVKQDLSNPKLAYEPSKTNNLYNHHIQNSNTNKLIHSFQHQQQLYHHLFQKQQKGLISSDIGYLTPIRGIPVYQNPHNSFPLIPQQHLNTSSTCSNTISSSPYPSQSLTRSRFLSRFPTKRSIRAPRMRWTTTLHSRFIHAVELLGGHERATPKSVLELMDVKDLTLAHVKSHLQMYRTVKTTDKAAASSGQSDLFENGSSRDTSEDLGFDVQTPLKSELLVQQGRLNGLWGNSSREAWLNGKPRDFRRDIIVHENKEMETKCVSYDRISAEVSSSSQISETNPPEREKPNLEFTLGI